MKLHSGVLSILLGGALAFGLSAPAQAGQFSIAKIYIEYNSTPNDLGYHVSLDGEDWRSLKILNPSGKTIFQVEGKKAYRDLGMTELFFEGAEPALEDVPLEELLALMPAGRYRFIGTTVDGERLESTAVLSHAVPAGPEVSAEISGNDLVIEWDPVTTAPEDFPVPTVTIVGYQVIVELFQITLPASATSVTIPEEYVRTLAPGEHIFEVLAIEASGNQTITEGTFTK